MINLLAYFIAKFGFYYESSPVSTDGKCINIECKMKPWLKGFVKLLGGNKYER